MNEEAVKKLFAGDVRRVIERMKIDMACVYEIRMRINSPLTVIWQGEEFFLKENGNFTREAALAYVVNAKDVKETMEYIAGYSLYAFEEEVKQGFLTIQGGHRVGIAGKAVVEENKVAGVKYISCINMRFSHEIKGCADHIIPYVYGKNEVLDTLIISPPRCGKTTLLRDLIRQISNGDQDRRRRGHSIAVVDERSEIGGCYQGVPQNDLGIRTDILDGCPKAEGMMMLVRSMSPEVIAVDELGNYEDVHAIESVVNCGCRLLATVHGNSIEDIRQKPLFQRLMNEHVFQRYILLGYETKAGVVKAIFNERGSCIYKGGQVTC